MIARWFKRLDVCGVLVCAVLLVPGIANADDCSVSATTMSFGDYYGTDPVAVTMTLAVTCIRTGNGSKNFTYDLKLKSGPVSYANRLMNSGANTLTYNLYTSPAYTTVWGDGSGGTSKVSGAITVPGNSSGTTYETVYGLLPGGQSVPTGFYQTTSAITVTISSVQAIDRTDAFFVNANVTTACTVSAPNLAFGAINPLSSQADSSMTMTVACTQNTGYTVGLSAGSTAGATVAQRLMANGTDTMLFNLYSNAARTTVWGNSSGSWVSGTGTGLNNNQSITVYGRVADGQTNLAAGNYAESITVTVTY